MFKRFAKMLCVTLFAALIFTGCNPSPDNSGAVNSSGNDSSSGVDGTNTDAPMGRYVQTVITPPGIKNVDVMQANQATDGTIVLCLQDLDTKTPRAFLLQDEEWTEQDNKPVVDFLGTQKFVGLNMCYDFEGNWWLGLVSQTDGLAVYKIGKDGKAVEIALPCAKEANDKDLAVRVDDFSADDSGKLRLTVMDSDGGTTWAIVDIATGKVISEIAQDTPQIKLIPDYRPILKGDKVYGYDKKAKTVEIYSAISGERLETVAVPIKQWERFSLDGENTLVYADTDGIHRAVLNGNVIQTVVDNKGFAYSQQKCAKWTVPGPDDTFWMVVNDETGAIGVYYYAIDRGLPTALGSKLNVWAMAENPMLEEAAGVFAKQNPDCEVVFKFGKTGATAGMTDEDIIKSLNTQLLAGEVPDVLMLDGLPIASLIERGMLSPLENIVDEKDYYTNILNCYQKDGRSYAYPANFKIPVLIGSGDGYDITKMDTLEQLATLYKDKEAISNTSYHDVFHTAYAAFSSRIVKDGMALDESALTDFLTQTKAMVAAQGITEENKQVVLTPDKVEYNLVPSIMSFRQNETQYATGIMESIGEGMLAFLTQKDVRIEPHPGKGFLPRNISSIPANAANKEQAASYIKILLSERAMQITGQASSFPVRKEFTPYAIADVLEKDKERGGDMQFVSDSQQFDWDGLIAKYEMPSNPEAFLRETVYEQAKLLYTNQVDVDTATEHIISKTRLYFAEKQ